MNVGGASLSLIVIVVVSIATRDASGNRPIEVELTTMSVCSAIAPSHAWNEPGPCDSKSCNRRLATIQVSWTTSESETRRRTGGDRRLRMRRFRPAVCCLTNCAQESSSPD